MPRLPDFDPPPYYHISDKGSEKPVFSVKLQCPTTIKFQEDCDVIITVTYDGVSDFPGQPPGTTVRFGARPVTFHTLAVIHPDLVGGEWSSSCRRANSTAWEKFYLNGQAEGDYGFYECHNAFSKVPNKKIHIGQDGGDFGDIDAKWFVTLNPGESWTIKQRLHRPFYNNLPYKTFTGDVFRYSFSGGAVVDWWDWGTKEVEHKKTTVTVPRRIWGKVMEPKDNDGRPVVIIPSSEPVEFTLVK